MEIARVSIRNSRGSSCQSYKTPRGRKTVQHVMEVDPGDESTEDKGRRDRG
jgi:hypothetical protein